LQYRLQYDRREETKNLLPCIRKVNSSDTGYKVLPRPVNTQSNPITYDRCRRNSNYLREPPSSQHALHVTALPVMDWKSHKLIDLPSTASKTFAFLQLCGSVLVLSGYTVEVPETSIIVSDWASLQTEVEKFADSMLMAKYGGNVIEVDGQVMLATTQDLTLEIQKMVDSLLEFTAEEDAEFEYIQDALGSGVDASMVKDACSNEGKAGGVLRERACASLMCRNDSICATYNDFHICGSGIGWGVGNSQQRGTCI
jgi:hypothetical protein